MQMLHTQLHTHCMQNMFLYIYEKKKKLILESIFVIDERKRRVFSGDSWA